MTLATWLTVGRLVAAPVFVVLLVEETRSALWTASGLFVLAALTDAVDGYLARRTGTISAVGRWLDPIADKILIAGAYLAFLSLGTPQVKVWMVAAIIGRELLVSALRHRAGRRGVIIHSSKLGKWKTGFQMGVAFAILALMSWRASANPAPAFWSDPATGALAPVLDGLVLVTTAITIVSGIDYLLKNRAVLGAAPAGTAR